MSTEVAESLNVIDTSGMTKTERFKLRRVGASDMPGICGVGYSDQSRLKIFFRCTGQLESENREDEDYDERFWWGDELEPLIAKRFAMRMKMQFAAHQVLVQHRDYPWMTATIDGVTTDGQIVDFKASSYWGSKGIKDGDEDTLPPQWIIQANQQMACCGRDQAHWAQFDGAQLRLRTFVIRRDPEIVEMIYQLGSEFWRCVETNTPPAEFEPGDGEFLAKRFVKKTGNYLTAVDNAELRKHARDYDNAKAAIKEMENQADISKAALLMALKDFDGALVGDGIEVQRLSKSRTNREKICACEMGETRSEWSEIKVKRGDLS
jgi:putative phage-type endonuclease